MNDPLRPEPVRPIQQGPSDAPAAYEDARPWYLRLLTSVRPSVTSETIKRTGQKAETFEVKGHVDF